VYTGNINREYKQTKSWGINKNQTLGLFFCLRVKELQRFKINERPGGKNE
jgi:hypothetical protein